MCIVPLVGAIWVALELVRSAVVSRLQRSVLRGMLTILVELVTARLSSVLCGTGSICRCPTVWLELMKLVMKLSAGNLSMMVGWLNRLRKFFRCTIVTWLFSPIVLLMLRAIRIIAPCMCRRNVRNLLRRCLWVTGLMVLNGLLTSSMGGLVVSVCVILICRCRFLDNRRGQWLLNALGLRLISLSTLLIWVVTWVPLYFRRW